MAYRVFIDGAEGTTGLRIRQRLESQPDIELLALPEASRKELAARLDRVAAADVSVLCLPDEAAKELAAAVGAQDRICDASTAHRTAPGWVYGFAELGGRRGEIAGASRVAVPGCHPSGFLALAAPLLEAGVLKRDALLSVTSLTGYSGGGKKMIAEYEADAPPQGYCSPRLYGLGQCHKHLPEMVAVTGMESPPLFLPIVDDYYCGMLVTLPLHAAQVGSKGLAELAIVLTAYYEGERLVQVHGAGEAPPDGTLAANALAGKDGMELYILGNDERPVLCARYDNLGKGASGAALQCLNLMLGREETAGLAL